MYYVAKEQEGKEQLSLAKEKGEMTIDLMFVVSCDSVISLN